MQLLIFSYAATYEVRNARIGFYCMDNSFVTEQFVSLFVGARSTFSTVYFYESYNQIAEALTNEKILFGLIIPDNFTESLLSGYPAKLQLILDGRKPNASSLAQGYVQEIIARFSAEYFAERSILKHFNKAVYPQIETRIWFNPNALSSWTFVPALVAVLSNIIVLMITALSIAREREMGTFDQLLVSPITSVEILIGKSFPALVIGFFEGVVMMFLITVLFQLPIGVQGMMMLAVVMVLFLLSIVGVGLFISAFVNTQQQAFLGAFAYQVPAILLSGFASPVENIKTGLQWVAKINPLQYMVTAARMIFLEQPSLSLIISTVWPLIPIAAVTLTAASLLFRKKLQ